MKSRQKFLSNKKHRIRFVFLPKHSSWLNQVEIVFGIIGRRVMRNASFKSKTELKTQLEEFVKYFNRTFARPFKWNYTGEKSREQTLKRPQIRKSNWERKRQTRKNLPLVG